MAMTLAVFVVYGLLANVFRRAVIESPRVQHWLRRSVAAVFAGLGLNLAFAQRWHQAKKCRRWLASPCSGWGGG